MLIVMSGNVLGFGVIVTPLMLTTCAVGGPELAKSSGSGVDLLKIPPEGFSPVRGELTPVVINDGAWQRTITPVQLDRRASEANVPVADFVRTLKPEDLAPCYSFVQITSENGAPVPAVRYWRQAGSDWGFGPGCGASN